MFLMYLSGCIWNEVESQVFEKLILEPIKGESKYMLGNLNTWRERIKTNYRGQDVPCHMYCNTIAVLKINSV